MAVASTRVRKSLAKALAFTLPRGVEDMVANLVTMNTATHDADPHPDLPECFTQKKEVVELVQGIAGQGSLADVVEGCDKDPPVLTVCVPAKEDAGPIGSAQRDDGCHREQTETKLATRTAGADLPGDAGIER